MKKITSLKITATINGIEHNGLISDGYHTFDELYDHRVALFIALCKELYHHPENDRNYPIWRSQLHSDGTSFDGWFILGICKGKGHQMTYHLPMSEWAETNFAETLEKAPEFDGHTPQDVLKRLRGL